MTLHGHGWFMIGVLVGLAIGSGLMAILGRVFVRLDAAALASIILTDDRIIDGVVAELDAARAALATVVARARPVREDGAGEDARPVAWLVDLSAGEVEWMKGLAGEDTP